MSTSLFLKHAFSWFSLTLVSMLKNAGHAINDCRQTFMKQLMFWFARPLFTLSKWVIENSRSSVNFKFISWLFSFAPPVSVATYLMTVAFFLVLPVSCQKLSKLFQSVRTGFGSSGTLASSLVSSYLPSSPSFSALSLCYLTFDVLSSGYFSVGSDLVVF